MLSISTTTDGLACLGGKAYGHGRSAEPVTAGHLPCRVGVAYLALAVAWWIGPRQVLWPMWIVMFAAAGVVSLSAVAADGRRWQAAAFAGLIGASAIRAGWHLWDVVAHLAHGRHCCTH